MPRLIETILDSIIQCPWIFTITTTGRRFSDKGGVMKLLAVLLPLLISGAAAAFGAYLAVQYQLRDLENNQAALAAQIAGVQRELGKDIAYQTERLGENRKALDAALNEAREWRKDHLIREHPRDKK